MTIVKNSSSSKQRARVSKPNLNFSPESVETTSGTSSDGGGGGGSDLSGFDSGMQSDGWDSTGPEEAGTEVVQLGSESFSVPIELYDLKDLSFILSVNTWNELLSEDERFRLANYLPDMDQETLSRTLGELFSARNFHFGSPLLDFSGKLKGGEFEPGVYLYRRSLNSFNRRKHYYNIRRYHNSMVRGLFQIKDTWEKCRGYGVQERLQLLKIRRSRKVLGDENGDDKIESPQDSDYENLRSKRIKIGNNSEARRRTPVEESDWSRNWRIGIVGDDLGRNGYELSVSQNSNAISKTSLARSRFLKAEKKQQFVKHYDELRDEDYAKMSRFPSKRKVSNEVTIASYAYHHPRDNLENSDYSEKDWMYSTKVQSPLRILGKAQVDLTDESQPIHYPVKFDGRSIDSTKWKLEGNSGAFGSKLGSDRSKQIYTNRVSNILKGENMKSKVNSKGSIFDQGGETESDASDEDGRNGNANPLVKQFIYSNGAVVGSTISRSAYDPLKFSKLGRHGEKPYALALKASEIQPYVRHGKQKAKMNLPAYLHSSEYPHTGERLALPYQKANSREKRQKGVINPVHSLPSADYMSNYNNVHMEEFQDALPAATKLQNGHLRSNRSRNQAQSVDDPVVETDHHNESYLPLLACNVATKKKTGKVGDICTDEAYENKKINDLDMQNKRKATTATGLLNATPDPINSEKETLENDLDARSQKKPFTLITPTVHSGFSFSIVHLLSAIRKAMVTSDMEDVAGVHKSKNEDSRTQEHGERNCLPSLTLQAIANRVKSNPGDPCILETQEPLQDLIRGVLKIFSSKTSPLGAKGWKPLVTYEKSNKGWSWVGPISSSLSDNDIILEEETSPEAWGIPSKMLLNLVNAFANWLKSSQETLKLIGSLPAPPNPVLPNLDEKERFRDLRAQKNPKTINPSSDELRAYFRKEEFIRYSIPDRAFSYTAADGKKSSVAPLRRGAGKPTSKARDHYMLKQDRPPHVTILCLVRDAASRLPGSIGTRADVCTLIRDSQYIVEDVTNSQVNQVVSGALDRLHYELDPCIHFDNDRKLWVYLHRDREEEDFEDDGTSSTKNWRRPRKDIMENSDVDGVNHGSDDPSEVVSAAGFDLNSDVNLGQSDHPSI